MPEKNSKDYGLDLKRQLELAILAQGSPAEQLTAQMIAEGHVEGYTEADRKFITQFVGDQRGRTAVKVELISAALPVKITCWAHAEPFVYDEETGAWWEPKCGVWIHVERK